MINIACQKPTAFGLSAELWYPASLTRFVNSVAETEGYPRMATASVSSIRKILRKAQLNPHKITYYCEKRDYEYKRLGTISLLAAIDLLTGEAIPLVGETHKSSDFVTFLRILDEKYPKGDKLRIILDNHSAHTSEETQRYLNETPDRFEFVFTPTHGSWLNLVEGFFSKMSRQMLDGIRVSSKAMLKERIYKYFDEVNAVPVPYKWKYKMDTIHLEDEDVREIVYEVVNAKAASLQNQGKRAPIPTKRKGTKENQDK